MSTRDDINQEIISFVKGEVTKYKDGEWFITENVSINTRELIRVLRKNYWGVFDDPIDPITKRKKVFPPVTRVVVDSTRKLSDIDLNMLSFIPKNADGIGVNNVVRGYTRDWMRYNNLGEAIDDSLLQMCIDGTAIWKTYSYRKNGKKYIKRCTVDILNVFIDPTADSIQAAQTFTERSLMSPSDVMAMDGWDNTKDIKTSKSLHRTQIDMVHQDSIGQYVDVYECYTLAPKYWVSGDKKKDTDWIDVRVVVSGLESGDVRVHLVERNTQKDRAGNVIKPYEEMRYMKVPGRWAGVGPAEMVMGIQEWISMIVNLRITKNTNASLGLFKIRRGAGVTQQMLSNLVARGVISLPEMNDLENMRIDEAGDSSYKDEAIAKNWAFEVTSTYDISRGAAGDASTSATASALQNTNAKTAFTLVVESVSHMLNRWLDRHYLPQVGELIKQEGLATIYNDFDDIEEIREKVVAYLAMQYLDESGVIPTEEEMMLAMEDAERKLRMNKNLFVDIVGDIVADNIDPVVSFLNETTDVNSMINNLVNMSGQIEDPEVRKEFQILTLDLMGLPVPEQLRKKQVPYGPTADSAINPMQTEQSLVTAANARIN